MPLSSPFGLGNNNNNNARFLSTYGRESIGRFQQALEDYRTKNYAQTIPPRFKKEITNVIRIRASPRRSLSSLSAPEEFYNNNCSSVEDQKRVAVEDIERFLQNIGALGEHKVTHQDVETIVSEFGEEEPDDIRAERIVTKLL